MKRRKLDANKIYEFIGRAVVYSACYIGLEVFSIWAFLQRNDLLGGKEDERKQRCKNNLS